MYGGRHDGGREWREGAIVGGQSGLRTMEERTEGTLEGAGEGGRVGAANVVTNPSSPARALFSPHSLPCV